MREIKFRGYISRQNRFEIPIGIIKAETIKEFKDSKSTQFPGEWCWNECGLILMQYIGLKDKNGKEIYEGDVLQQKKLDGSVFLFKIFSVKGGFAFNTHQDDFYKPQGKIYFYDSTSDMQNSGFISTLEIIGNIFENPELLKK